MGDPFKHAFEGARAWCASQTYRDKYPNNKLYKAINTMRPTLWNTLFEFETGFGFQDKWSMLRQKLLESFMLALFALYRACHFNRVKRELQIAQLWTGHSLQTREEMESFVQLQKIKATNRSIPYTEEYQAMGDPFKHAFDGAHAYAVCEASGAYHVSVGGMTGCQYRFTLSEGQQDIIRNLEVYYGTFQAYQTPDGSTYKYQYAGLLPKQIEQCHKDAKALPLASRLHYKDVIRSSSHKAETLRISCGEYRSSEKALHFASKPSFVPLWK